MSVVLLMLRRESLVRARAAEAAVNVLLVWIGQTRKYDSLLARQSINSTYKFIWKIKWGFIIAKAAVLTLPQGITLRQAWSKPKIFLNNLFHIILQQALLESKHRWLEPFLISETGDWELALKSNPPFTGLGGKTWLHNIFNQES